jgi:hypothetical protein
MNRKDVHEIKSRLKKTGCTFTKMSGCYVNSAKEIVVNINETFLNLEENEFYKYLEIAKKTLSGTVGNNLIELNFPEEEEKEGGKQQFLMGLRESKLKNEGLLDTFFQMIIDNYDYVGNYLILVFHDAYDVMTKTSDNSKLDESEEVYEYLLFAICPVALSKPALGYLEDENKIGARNRDWVVGAPDTGFIFPAFTERSTDIHSVMFYTKDTQEPHKEMMEIVLGCPAKSTATEKKNTFYSMIAQAVNDEEKSEEIIIELQDSLSQIVEEHEVFADEFAEPVILTREVVKEVLEEQKIPVEIAAKIENTFMETFSDEPPAVEHVIDKKALAESEKRKVNLAFVEKIHMLEEKLEESKKQGSSVEVAEGEIVLQVKDEKVTQITTQVIDGKKCIVIPMEEDEHANINGILNFL